jgi:Flp pilus assembly pilin Flp
VELFFQLIDGDEGQDLIEYGLLIGIVTLAAVTAVVAIGGTVSTYFANLDSNLP